MKSTFEQLTRCMLIVNYLDGENVYVMPDRLICHLGEACEVRGVDFPTDRAAALRTIQRDIRRIWELMAITIVYAKNKGYYIKECNNSDAVYRYDKLLSDYDMLTAVDPKSKLSEYIIAERHRPVGSANLYPVLEAIKERRYIEFDYTLVRHDNCVRHYRVAPHFIKEDQQRWYIIAKQDDKFKIFSIDRISGLTVDYDSEFDRDSSYDPRKAFDHCYGIWDDPSLPVEEIELAYDALDGSFLKRVPLHASQTVLVDTPDEFRIRLRLRITNDFVMALLSRSRSLTVIKPLSLRQRIFNILRSATTRNETSS
ncbi:MAG: WYL domain-containing protein [Muribaculaceae bacterium]|nr:WYL domain-containing protein [Muribaculaceae bacterium]